MTRAYVLDSTTRDVIGLVDQSWERLAYTRRYFGMDTFEMAINRSRLYASELVNGRLLYLPDEGNRIFQIEQIHSTQEGSVANDLMTVAGRSLEGIAMAERLVIPPSGQGHDEQTAVPAETAIKHYVTNHAGSGAPASRQVPGLVVAADAASGSNVTTAGRYQSVFDMVKEIGLLVGLGWEIVYDPIGDDYVFDIITGVDRSASVFFDFAFETLEKWEELASLADSKTVAVVAGQGEGALREVVTRYLGTEPTGFERREAFIDARDIEPGSSALSGRGDAFLEASAGETRIEATVHQFGSFRYGEDWDMGDIVLVRNEERGISYSARIVEVEKAFDVSASAPVVTAIIDRPFPTMKEQVNGAGAGIGAVDFAPVAGEIVYPKVVRQGGFILSGTSNLYNGQWTKVASGSLPVQYADHRFTLEVINEGSSTADATRGKLYVAVKQQAAFGNQPDVLVEWDGADAEADDWAVVVTSVAGPTTWELHHRVDQTYNTVRVVPLIIDADYSSLALVFHDVQGFSASLPAGTAYTGVWRSPTFASIGLHPTSLAADVILSRIAAGTLKLAGAAGAAGLLNIEGGSSGSEGGEINLEGAAAYADWHIDNYQGQARIFTGAQVRLYVRDTAPQVEVSGDFRASGNAEFGAAGAGQSADGLRVSGGNLELRNANPFIDFKISDIDYGARIIYDYNISDGLEFVGAAEYKFDNLVTVAGDLAVTGYVKGSDSSFTISGGGTATFGSKTMEWWVLGPLVVFRFGFTVTAAGSGTTEVSVSSSSMPGSAVTTYISGDRGGVGVRPLGGRVGGGATFSMPRMNPFSTGTTYLDASPVTGADLANGAGYSFTGAYFKYGA